MKRELKILERRVINTRNRLEKKGQRMAYRALMAQVPKDILTVDTAINQMESISDEPIKQFFKRFYAMTGREIGMIYFDFLKKKDDFLESVFYEEMERFAINEAGERIVMITGTTRNLLIDATKNAIQRGTTEGYGIEKIKRLILQECKNAIKPSRARAIAQTEVISASNQASFRAAEKTGLTFKKYWSTSGLANIRDTHLQAEFDSVNGLTMNERFSNGLMYPGEPGAAPEEVINCRCTLLQLPIS